MKEFKYLVRTIFAEDEREIELNCRLNVKDRGWRETRL